MNEVKKNRQIDKVDEENKKIDKRLQKSEIREIKYVLKSRYPTGQQRYLVVADKTRNWTNVTSQRTTTFQLLGPRLRLAVKNDSDRRK